MKKFLKVFTLFLILTLVILSSENKAYASENDDIEIVNFEDLPGYAKKNFIEEGFTGNEEYFQTTTIQMINNTNENDISVRGLPIFNVVKTYGSTKREDSRRAKTSYTIESSKLNITRADLKTIATGGGRTLNGSSTIKPNAKIGKGTTIITHSGKSTYFTFKSNTQVTTTAGLVPEIYRRSVGGTTLGY